MRARDDNPEWEAPGLRVRKLDPDWEAQLIRRLAAARASRARFHPHLSCRCEACRVRRRAGARGYTRGTVTV